MSLLLAAKFPPQERGSEQWRDMEDRVSLFKAFPGPLCRTPIGSHTLPAIFSVCVPLYSAKRGLGSALDSEKKTWKGDDPTCFISSVSILVTAEATNNIFESRASGSIPSWRDPISKEQHGDLRESNCTASVSFQHPSSCCHCGPLGSATSPEVPGLCKAAGAVLLSPQLHRALRSQGESGEAGPASLTNDHAFKMGWSLWLKLWRHSQERNEWEGGEEQRGKHRWWGVGEEGRKNKGTKTSELWIQML